MVRYRALIAYDGSDFHGWQIQPGVPTVEGELTRALARISGVESKVQGASRTDAGVHAQGQVAHFDYAGRLRARELKKALNAIATPSVRVMRCQEVAAEFHARYDARGKRYRYDLWVDRVHHPLHRRRTLHVPYRVDVEAMARAGRELVGRHDFTSFRASTCDAPSPALALQRVELRGEPPGVSVVVEGAAFLKYMVRTMVGTLLEVGRGKRRSDSMPDLLAARDRHAAGVTAKPHALHLVEVFYPDWPWDETDGAGLDASERSHTR